MPLIVVANLAVGKTWANTAIWITGGLAAWGIAASSALDLGYRLLTGSTSQTDFAIDAGSVVSGVAAAGFLFRPIRKDMSAYLPIDPENPVHALALVLAVIYFGVSVTPLLFTDVLSILMKQPAQTVFDTIVNELPLLVLAAAGVGLFIRRKLPDAAVRLGLVRPAWWHPVLALAAAGAFLAALEGFDLANHWLLPDLAARIDATDRHLFGQLEGTSWLGVVVISLLPGICEDLLFRGALQPRIGLLPTALLFTAIHSQYGLSLDLAGVFVVAVCLGLIRKYTNTTTSMTTHVAYNLLAGISLAGIVLYAAVGLEVVLLAVAAFGIWRFRRAPRPAIP